MRRRTTSSPRPRSRRRVSGSTTHRRRRRTRVSGFSGSMIMDAAEVIVGAVGGRMVSNIIIKAMPSISPTIINGAQIALGMFLPSLVKSNVGKNLGMGMIAGGGQLLLVNLGVISGARPMHYRINGTPNLQAINGAPNFKAINGMRSGITVPELQNWTTGLKSIAQHPDTI